MKKLVYFILILFAFPVLLQAKERIQLTPDMSDREIKNLHPSAVDPSLLPLDSIEELHVTGTVKPVDVQTWELEVGGNAVDKPLFLRYETLSDMDMVKKKAILICPGFFVDYAQWEGVLLRDVLEKAGVKESYSRVSFYALDGFVEHFSRDEVENLFIILALRVNGKKLPQEHGFPVRVVAEDVYGGRWVKWLRNIQVN